MIVEFKTVRASSLEQYEKSKDMELQGKDIHLEFFNTQDYITSIFVEMDDIIDFTVGKAYCNSEVFECIYIRFTEENISPNILIKGEEFKRILEHTRNMKIKTSDEILNIIHNENNPTSI